MVLIDIPMHLESQNKPVMIQTSCPNQITAQNFANHLVKKQLAACVTLTEALSTYVWDNSIVEEMEVQIQIKTVSCFQNAILAEIERELGEETPQFIVIPINNISVAYNKWLLQTLNINDKG
mgnify:CR=1 FL=1